MGSIRGLLVDFYSSFQAAKAKAWKGQNLASVLDGKESLVVPYIIVPVLLADDVWRRERLWALKKLKGRDCSPPWEAGIAGSLFQTVQKLA
jgi:hypothetical protein